MKMGRGWSFSVAGSLLICLLLGATTRAEGQAGKADTKAKKEASAKELSIAEPQKLPPIELQLVSIPPVIDGVLDDEAWKAKPLRLSEWLTYNPYLRRALTPEDASLGHL